MGFQLRLKLQLHQRRVVAVARWVTITDNLS